MILRRSTNFEEELLEICDDSLDEGEDDVVGIENVDVGGGLAQLHAGDGGGLGHGLRAVRNERLLDDVDELLLPDVLRRTRSPGVCVVDLFQNVGRQNLNQNFGLITGLDRAVLPWFPQKGAIQFRFEQTGVLYKKSLRTPFIWKRRKFKECYSINIFPVK